MIQAALAGHGPSRDRPGSAGISSPPASGVAFSLLDLDADTGNTTPLAANPLLRARLRRPADRPEAILPESVTRTRGR